MHPFSPRFSVNGSFQIYLLLLCVYKQFKRKLLFSFSCLCNPFTFHISKCQILIRVTQLILNNGRNNYEKFKKKHTHMRAMVLPLASILGIMPLCLYVFCCIAKDHLYVCIAFKNKILINGF